MTALRQYERLECTGRWHETPGGGARDVVVSFGATSLILSDPKGGRALAHWSLPAVTRLAGCDAAARYAPAPDADETLEIDDASMIDALETVRRAVTGRPPRARWMRPVIYGALGLGLVVAAALWLPEAAVRHTAAAVPQAKRAEIGHAVLRELSGGAAAICDANAGRDALETLNRAVGGTHPDRLVVVDPPGSAALRGGALALPGGVIAIHAAVLRAADDPAIAAGHVLAAQARPADPLAALLRAAGLRTTLMLLATGELPDRALRHAGAVMPAPGPPAPERLATRFAGSGVPARPYAMAVDPSGALARGLAAAGADAAADAAPPLDAAQWAGLRAICGG